MYYTTVKWDRASTHTHKHPHTQRQLHQKNPPRTFTSTLNTFVFVQHFSRFPFLFLSSGCLPFNFHELWQGPVLSTDESGFIDIMQEVYSAGACTVSDISVNELSLRPYDEHSKWIIVYKLG